MLDYATSRQSWLNFLKRKCFHFYWNPCEYVTRVRRQGDQVPEAALYLHQVGSGSQAWWVISLVPYFREWDTVCMFSYSGELSFGWWVLVLKWDDSRLKWTSHLIQMLLKIGPSGTKEMAHRLRALNAVQFPASTWHQMELQLSVTPSDALFRPLMHRHTCWLNTHIFKRVKTSFRVRSTHVEDKARIGWLDFMSEEILVEVFYV